MPAGQRRLGNLRHAVHGGAGTDRGRLHPARAHCRCRGQYGQRHRLHLDARPDRAVVRAHDPDQPGQPERCRDRHLHVWRCHHRRDLRVPYRQRGLDGLHHTAHDCVADRWLALVRRAPARWRGEHRSRSDCLVDDRYDGADEHRHDHVRPVRLRDHLDRDVRTRRRGLGRGLRVPHRRGRVDDLHHAVAADGPRRRQPYLLCPHC